MSEVASTGPGPTVISASAFVVEVDGVQVATFSELSSMSSEVTPTTYIATSSQSGSVAVPTKQFGNPATPHVTLTRSLDTDAYLWSWHQAVLQGDPTARRTCSLQLFAAGEPPKTGRPVATFILENAWPSKLEIAGMKAGASEVVMETVVLVCDRILRQPAG